MVRNALRRGRAGLGWACLGAVAVLAAGGAARNGAGFALGWPGWPTCAAVSAAVLLFARAGVPGQGDLLLGLAPAFVGLLTISAWPGVAALSGALLWAVVLQALVLGARRPPPAWLFLPVCALLYVSTALRVQEQVGAEGDEPHYLMVAESLLRDGDVSLETDYAAGRYRAFYRTRPLLEPHYLVRGRHGEIFSQHALGLSLLVLPAYALGGYAAASVFLALLAVWLAYELRGLLRDFLPERGLADRLAWILAASPPLVHFAGLLFTEIPAALAVAFALRRLRQPRELSGLQALAVGAALAFLPWLNVRYLPFPLLLLVYALWARPPRRTLLLLVLPLLGSAAALGIYHHALYGFFDPRLVYGRRPGFAWSRVLPNLEAMLFDQEFGLFAYAPVFALALPGALTLVRRSSLRTSFAILAPIGAVLLTACAWRMWWGGFTPPARFLVPSVPLLAIAIGTGLRRIGARAALLAGFSLFLGLAGAWQPRLVHRDRDGTAPLWREASSAHEWTRLLPAYVLPDADPVRHRLALLWGLSLLAAVWPRREQTRPSGLGLALSLGGLIASTGLAASLGTSRAGGREAVRVIGRPALLLPEWRTVSRAVARWGPEELAWGPLYESHRFPDGAEFASRLPLPPGVYRLSLLLELVPGARALAIELVREPGLRRERLALHCEPAGRCAARIIAEPRDKALSLRLVAGGPLVFKQAQLAGELEAQPPGPRAGPS